MVWASSTSIVSKVEDLHRKSHILTILDLKVGFQKEVGLVTRSGPEWPPYAVYGRNANIDADTAPDGRVWLSRYGPKLVFHMRLDSGASNPNIYQHDLELLGVHTDDYPAQTITRFNTANGDALMRTYDLKVELVDGRNNSMVDPNDAIHPEFPPLLGAVVGVAMIENGKVYKQETDAWEFFTVPGRGYPARCPSTPHIPRPHRETTWSCLERTGMTCSDLRRCHQLGGGSLAHSRIREESRATNSLGIPSLLSPIATEPSSTKT
jgi:hypothetical protein